MGCWSRTSGRGLFIRAAGLVARWRAAPQASAAAPFPDLGRCQLDPAPRERVRNLLVAIPRAKHLFDALEVIPQRGFHVRRALAIALGVGLDGPHRAGGGFSLISHRHSQLLNLKGLTLYS
jgi:hypothetical protein